MKSSPNEHVGFSAARLDVITGKIRADIDAGLIPGAVMLIATSDTVVYETALGMQVPQSGKPMALDSIFRIYSMTKPIVSVAVMMLVEEGRILLSDPIDKYLPEFRRMKVGVEVAEAGGGRSLQLTDARQPITVQDLLRHTSGLTYGIFGESLVKSEYLKAGVGTVKASSAEFIERIARLPLAYQPGTTWEYSHSTDVLGVLLERICDAPLDTVLAERILGPLRMHETGFQVQPAHANRVAEPFAVDPVTGNTVKLLDPMRRPSFLSGGGGMMSTVYDYLRFARMLLNEGELDGERILSRATLRYMASDHLGQLPEARAGASFLPGPGYGFGLGFGVRISPGNAFIPGSVGDYTWSGLAGTYFWIDPVEKMLAIFLMQAPEQRNHYRQLFRNLVYGALN